MSSSTARIVLKRGSAALFRSSFRGFRRLVPDANSSIFSSSNGKRIYPFDTLDMEHNFSLGQRELEKVRAEIERACRTTLAQDEKMYNKLRYRIEEMCNETLAQNEKTRIEIMNDICENRSIFREIDASFAEVKAGNKFIKYCLGTLALGVLLEVLVISAVGHEGSGHGIQPLANGEPEKV